MKWVALIVTLAALCGNVYYCHKAREYRRETERLNADTLCILESRR